MGTADVITRSGLIPPKVCSRFTSRPVFSLGGCGNWRVTHSDCPLNLASHWAFVHKRTRVGTRQERASGMSARSQVTACVSSRGHQPLAHQEAAPQDPPGAAQGCLYWGVASCPSGLLRGPGWAERLPSPHRDQQEGEMLGPAWRVQSGRGKAAGSGFQSLSLLPYWSFWSSYGLNCSCDGHSSDLGVSPEGVLVQFLVWRGRRAFLSLSPRGGGAVSIRCRSWIAVSLEPASFPFCSELGTPHR